MAFMNYIIILFIIMNNNHTKGTTVRSYLFLKQTKNLNCNTLSTNTITSPTLSQSATYCTVSCIQKAQTACSCIGWTKQNDACRFCYECSGGGSTSPLTATYVPYDPKTGLYHFSNRTYSN